MLGVDEVRVDAVELAERVRHAPVAVERDRVAVLLVDLAGLRQRRERRLVEACDVDHALGVDDVSDLSVVLARGVEVLLRHPVRRPRCRVVQARFRCRQHLVDTGEAVDHLHHPLARMQQVGLRELAHRGVEPGHHLRDVVGPAVRRAEHDEPAALLAVPLRVPHRGPAIGMPEGEGARDESAHRVGDEMHGRLRLEPVAHVRAQRVGGEREVLAPVVPERPHAPLGREVEQQLAVRALEDARCADGRSGHRVGEAVRGELEARDAAGQEAEDLHPDPRGAAVGGVHRQLPAHDPVQHDHVAGDGRRRPAHVAVQRALLHARIAVLAEVGDERVLFLAARLRDQPRELVGVSRLHPGDVRALVESFVSHAERTPPTCSA